MREVVIVDGVRTPFGKRGGALREHHPAMLGGTVLVELLKRTGVDALEVDDVVFGCVSQVGAQSNNIARAAWLAAGLPMETPSTTVDCQCGSSQRAIHFAANLISSGYADVTIAGGVESMSQVPIGSNMHGPGEPNPPELLERFDLVHQGVSAELIARKYGISRREMDEFGVRSHHRAAAATADGRFRPHLLPSAGRSKEGAEILVDSDEGIRPNASYEAAAALAPAFHPEHSITAGNSSQMTDGAAALLLMSREKAAALGLKPRAKIVGQKVVGCDPVLMLEGPIPATAAILKQTGLRLSDIDLFEINEAFASVILAWLKETGADPERTNVNGGAIALGHPLGASGARLMIQLLAELERRDRRYGLESMCCGGGIGTATVIDRAL